MKCSMSGQNMKIFHRAFQYLSRIGDEIHFEPFDSGLCISTVNSKKTAYAAVKFELDFFLDFESDLENIPEDKNCRVSIKPILPLFRSLKQVETGTVLLDPKSCRLTFQFKCRQIITRTHCIHILEYNRFGDLCVPENFSNKISSSHKLMNDIVSNFHKTTREISFEVTSTSIDVKNHIDNPDRDNKSIRCSYKLRTEEFETFSVKEETTIAFSYPDFRAFNHFADSNDINLLISFGQPGEPLYMSCTETGLHFGGTLLLATVVNDAEYTADGEGNQNAEQNVSNTTSGTSVEQPAKPNRDTARRRRKRVINVHDQDNPFQFMSENANTEEEIEPVKKRSKHAPSVSSIDRESVPETVSSAGSSRSYVSSSKNPEVHENIPPKNQKENTQPNHSGQRVSNDILLRPVQNDLLRPSIIRHDLANERISEDLDSIAEEIPETNSENMDIDESIPPSPNSQYRRKRRIFKRIFEKTFDPQAVPGANVILAYNSEDES